MKLLIIKIFLNNLKTTNKIINPPPKPEAGIYQFSKVPGGPITPAEYTGKKAGDQGKSCLPS